MAENLPLGPGVQPKKYESTVIGHRKQQSANQLATSFWDFVTQDPNGTYFSPGYNGQVYFTQNQWNYLSLSASPNDADTGKPTTNKTVISPGICSVSIRKQYARDINKPAKGNAAIVVPTGIEIPTINIRFLIWTAQQWGAFQQFAGIYVPTPKQPPNAFSAYHPVLKLHNISALNIWGLDGPQDGEFPRSKVFTLICTEWVPPEVTKIVPPAPDDNIYQNYYVTPPQNSLQSTPGNTTPPAAPSGLGQ